MYSYPFDLLKKVACLFMSPFAPYLALSSFFKILLTKLLNSRDHLFSYLFTSGAGSLITDFTSLSLVNYSFGAFPSINSRIVIPRDHISDLLV